MTCIFFFFLQTEFLSIGNEHVNQMEKKVFLESGKKRKKDIEKPDYARCIICLSLEVRSLNKVQKETVEKLKEAMDVRNDKVSDRLKEPV